MSDRYFLDTNIFVYCFDHSNRKKQIRANSLVKGALADHTGLISSQVIQEFLNVATRKFASPMTSEEAQGYLDSVLSPLCEVYATLNLYKEALSIKKEIGCAFYDALIVAAAVLANCRSLYSEDLNAGQKIRGVTVKNPFNDN
jgi:predicted nucleic acid-binding protein